MTEKRLLKGLAKGNVKCYEKLVDTYAKYVTVVVQNVGRALSTQDIEELVADVFIKIWNNREKLDIKEECVCMCGDIDCSQVAHVCLLVVVEVCLLFVGRDGAFFFFPVNDFVLNDTERL